MVDVKNSSKEELEELRKRTIRVVEWRYNKNIAEDAVQNAFVEHLAGKAQKDVAFSTVALRNACDDEKREGTRRKYEPALVDLYEPIARENPDDQVDRTRTVNKLLGAANLKAEERDVFVRRSVGQSFEQIAEEMRMNANTARSHHSRARKKIEAAKLAGLNGFPWTTIALVGGGLSSGTIGLAFGNTNRALDLGGALIAGCVAIALVWVYRARIGELVHHLVDSFFIWILPPAVLAVSLAIWVGPIWHLHNEYKAKGIPTGCLKTGYPSRHCTPTDFRAYEGVSDLIGPVLVLGLYWSPFVGALAIGVYYSSRDASLRKRARRDYWARFDDLSVRRISSRIMDDAVEFCLDGQAFPNVESLVPLIERLDDHTGELTQVEVRGDQPWLMVPLSAHARALSVMPDLVAANTRRRSLTYRT